MVEIATVLAAETLFEKMITLAYRFYGWMYPIENKNKQARLTESFKKAKNGKI